MHGRLHRRAAMQVNYDFYENLDSRQGRRNFRTASGREKPPPVPVISGALHERQPAEVPVISKRFGIPNSHKIDVYMKHDGYQALEKALKQMTPDQIIDEVKKSGLRGRGGAGFPTGMKWSFVPKDTASPNTFSPMVTRASRALPKTARCSKWIPHQLIEGMVIAGRAIGSNQGYIYIRGEYRYIIDIVETGHRRSLRQGLSRQEYSRQRI